MDRIEMELSLAQAELSAARLDLEFCVNPELVPYYTRMVASAEWYLHYLQDNVPF